MYEAPLGLGISEALFVTLDGFSPTSKFYLPPGETRILLPPGNHEISHYVRCSDEVTTCRYSPMKVRFDTKAAGVYTMTFTRFGHSPRGPLSPKAGYTINYEGWSEEEQAQWPRENLAR